MDFEQHNVSLPPPVDPKPKRTRRRNPVNCNFCRKRKLKCDRKQPCSNCVKRDLGSSCFYISGDHKTKSSERHLDSITPPDEKLKFSNFAENFSDEEQATHLRQQLNKMEMLVLSMLQDKKEGSSDFSPIFPLKSSTEKKVPIADNSEKDQDGLGMLHVESSGKAAYHGDTHWVSMLSEIQQLEEVLRTIQITSKKNHINVSQAMIFDKNDNDLTPLPILKPTTIQMTPIDALKTLPSRTVCDFLVNRFFLVMNPCFQLVHQPVFELQYNKFWENPTSFDLVWMCLLFLMISLALQSYLEEDLPPIFQENAKKTWEVWLQSAEVCGVFAKLTYKPSLINLKCLILWIFVQSDARTKLNWIEQVSLTISMVVRMSQAMGMHRDPNFFSLSPFDMEERRRMWHIVHFLDMSISLGRGLPSQIVPNGYDTKTPSNLNPSDLMPKYEKSPMAYPNSIQTESSFSIYRAKMLNLITEILDFSNGTSTIDKYEQTLIYHKMVENIYFEAPSFLSTSVLNCDMSQPDPGNLIQMVWFELEYLRTILILHRKYGTRATVRFNENEDNSKFLNSRHEMMKASLRTIEVVYWSIFKENHVRAIYGKLTWMFFFQTFLHSAIFSAITLTDNFDDYTLQQQQEYTQIIRNSVTIFEKNKDFTGDCQRVELILNAIISTMEDTTKLTKKQRAERVQKKFKEKRKLNTYTLTHEGLALAGGNLRSFESLGETGENYSEISKFLFPKTTPSPGIWDLQVNMKNSSNNSCNGQNFSETNNFGVPMQSLISPDTEGPSIKTPVANMVDQCANSTLESSIDTMLTGFLDMDEFDPFYVASQFQFNHGWDQ